jgi:hypothetical protein
MFPADSHSMRQMHAAEMHTAHQRRTTGNVVAADEQRWYRSLVAKLSIRDLLPKRPDTTAVARIQRRDGQATAGFTLLDATTGRRLEE